MVGLLAGILNAERTGRGCDVDVSLHDTAISMLNYIAIWTLNRNYHPARLADSAHPTLYPAQVFETADSYLVVLCFKEKFWQSLTALMGADDLAVDPRYGSFQARYQNREPLIKDLKPRFRSRTTADWLTLLEGHVPCAPVKSVEEALRDDQVAAREMILEVEHPTFGTLREVGTAIRSPGDQRRLRPGPTLGADTEVTLRDLLGYSQEQIRRLVQAGVV
jgi:crotonobetainyl-CoA:carnitine CoA-transferase CaiB-like acyl-CoA transferase